MYELYHADYSTCSQKVRLCLAEKKADFKSTIINLAAQEQLKPEYLAINPNGVVPALKSGSEVIVDSSVICEYLEEVHPFPPLSPHSPVQRAHMRSWMRYFEEVPTTAIRVPSFNKLFMQIIGAMPRDDFEAMADRMPLRKHFYLKMNGADGFNEETYKESIERLSATINRMETALSKEGPWIMGSSFTIADIIVIPTFVRMEDLGLEELWADAPAVARWYQDVQRRPSFSQAYYPGSRVDISMFAVS